MTEASAKMKGNPDMALIGRYISIVIVPVEASANG